MDVEENLLVSINAEVKESNKQIAKLYKRLDKAEEEASPVVRKRKKEQLQEGIDLCQANLRDSQNARKVIFNAWPQKQQLPTMEGLKVEVLSNWTQKADQQ